MAENDFHILILSSWYPTVDKPFLGNFVQRQAQLLSSKYRVTVIHTVVDEKVRSFETKESINDALIEIIVKHPKKKSIFGKLRQQRKALDHGLNLIDDIDLIIGNVLLPKGHQFVAVAKHYHCPLIYIEHGSYFRPEKRNIWSKTERLILKMVKQNAKEVIAVSDFLKDDLKKDFNRFDIKVIGNHIDTSIFNARPKIRNEITQFLHVSTLDENTKNPTGIIDACSLLKNATSKFKLTVISDEDYSTLQKYVVEKQLSDHVEFIGPLEWDELPSYYQAADAFILFSNYESFSIVLAEAWATGTPVISTSVGIAHNMPEQLGIQVEMNNPESLCEGMRKIVDGEIEFNSEQIVAHAQNFSETTILNKWTAIIDKYVG